MPQVIIDTSKFEAEIDGVITRAADARPALQAWGQHMVGSVKRNFAEQGRPTPWRPLKVNTLIARYLRRSSAKKIEKTGGRFDANPNLYKKTKGKLGTGDVGAISTVAGFARSSKTGRVLRSQHEGYNKFAPKGMVFRKPALRAIMTGKILQDTGRLRGSVSWEMQGNGKVGIGTNVRYAGVHQFGYPEKGITDRPFLVVQAEDEEEFEQLVTEWVSGVWGG